MTNLPPLTDKQIRDTERDNVYIFNVSPREHRIWAVGRMWVIPACQPGHSVSPALKIPGVFWKTDVKKLVGNLPEMEWIGTDGVDVAKRILGQDAFQHESADMIRLGCFSSMNPEAEPHEIAKAMDEWLARCDEKVREGDQIVSINNGMIQAENGKLIYGITKDHIEAATILGVERTWSSKNQKMTLCDECGTGNLPTAAKCKNCSVVLNEETFKRKFPLEWAARQEVLNASTEPAKRPVGRPRNEDREQ
jgi:hypothetical protein